MNFMKWSIKYWTWLMNWLCLQSAFHVKLWTGVISFSSPPCERLTQQLITEWGSSKTFYVYIALSNTPLQYQWYCYDQSNVRDEAGAQSAARPVMVSARRHLRKLNCLLRSIFTAPPNHTQPQSCMHSIPNSTHQLCVCASSWPPLSSCVSQLCRLIKVLFSLSLLISITTGNTSAQG